MVCSNAAAKNDSPLLLVRPREDSDTGSVYELALTPHMHSEERKSTRGSAVFSLTATMVGGGVLSLSYAFSLAGLAVGLCLLVCSATVSGFSVSLLLSCSRRSGAVSYEAGATAGEAAGALLPSSEPAAARESCARALRPFCIHRAFCF